VLLLELAKGLIKSDAEGELLTGVMAWFSIIIFREGSLRSVGIRAHQGHEMRASGEGFDR
jgi:hypothetical protein